MAESPDVGHDGSATGSDSPRLWRRSAASEPVRIGLIDGWMKPEDLVAGLRLPKAGSHIKPGDVMATVVITTKVCEGDLCTYERSMVPLQTDMRFQVLRVNPALALDPLLVQEDPEGRGWLLEVDLDVPGNL